MASGLHHPLALALTLSRPFRPGGKENGGQRKKFGETPFDGRFAHPAMFWCYAHQAASKVGTFGNRHRLDIPASAQSPRPFSKLTALLLTHTVLP